MIIKPINDNIVIEVEEVKKEILSDCGIVISANNTQARPDKGVVVACGEGRVSLNGDVIPMKVSAGDGIIFNRFSGTELFVEDKKYLIIKECDILAKIQ